MNDDTFTLSITLGNEAMQEMRDVSRVLWDVADRVYSGADSGLIHDDNGNRVGAFGLVPGF